MTIQQVEEITREKYMNYYNKGLITKREMESLVATETLVNYRKIEEHHNFVLASARRVVAKCL